MAKPNVINAIELWPIERVKPNPRNPKVHTDAAVRELADFIEAVGFNNPLGVNSNGDLLKGHRSLRAAKLLGLNRVPVVVLDHMTAEQRRVYALGDNQIALSSPFDVELLREELLDLRNLGIEWDLMGFDPETINGLFALPEPAAEPEPEPEDEPEPERGQPLAIVLQPDELRRWRAAKKSLGLTLDRAALLRLVDRFLGDSDG